MRARVRERWKEVLIVQVSILYLREEQRRGQLLRFMFEVELELCDAEFVVDCAEDHAVGHEGFCGVICEVEHRHRFGGFALSYEG